MTDKQQEPSREELLRTLEQASGRRIRTREDIKTYVDELAARKAVDLPSVRRWQKVKTVTLIALAAFAFVQYYVMDVMTQIMALRENTYFVPVSAPLVRGIFVTPWVDTARSARITHAMVVGPALPEVNAVQRARLDEASRAGLRVRLRD